MRRLIWLVLLLGGCAAAPPREVGDLSAFDALALHEAGALLILDVWSDAELRRHAPKTPLIRIQFGPDDWTAAAAGETDASAFAEKIRAASDGRPIALLCLYGVRSAAAAQALGRHGIAARNVADGFLGNRHGPGWRAWE